MRRLGWVGWMMVLAGMVTLGPLPAQALERVTCPLDLADVDTAVQCFVHVVPADRDDSAAGTVELMVMRISSYAADPAPDPVVYLEGGPGGAPIPYVYAFVESPVLADRDLILVDQRGTGYSRPHLGCPELYEVTYDATPEDDRLALTSCRDRLQAEGVDLANFTTTDAAHDLEALRQAMGYDRWNLYGISYGTRLALETMRLHPQGIRSVVLDSVFPPEVDAFTTTGSLVDQAISELDTACSLDPECAGAVPDLAGLIDDIADRLDASPEAADVPYLDWSGLVSYETIDGATFRWAVASAMYDADLLTVLPWTLDRIDGGDVGALGTLVGMASAGAVPEGDSEGLYHSVMCADELPFEDPAQVEAAFQATPEYFGLLSPAETCEVWGVPASEPAASEPVASDIPTLVLTSSVDPATPAEWGADAAEGLTAATLVEIAAGGHGVSTQGCGGDIMGAFLDDPGAELDVACASTPLDFEMRPVPVLGSRFDGFSEEAPGLVAVAGIWWFIAALGVVAAALRTRLGSGIHHWLWLLAVTLLGVFGPLAAVAVGWEVYTSTSFLGYLAFPARWWPVFLLPWAALVVALLAGLLTLVAISRGRSPGWPIVVYGLIGASLVALLVVYGTIGVVPLPV